MIWKNFIVWMRDKSKFYHTKTLFTTIFPINNIIYYFWRWNCTNYGNTTTHAIHSTHNTLSFFLYSYSTNRNYIWMKWWISKLKNIIISITFISIIIIRLRWTLFCFNNSINISLTIIIIAIFISIIFNIILSSWYRLILFLIYIGGIIVIFSYFVRLSSNESIRLKKNIHLFILPIILIKTLKLQITVPNFNYRQINKFYLSINSITILLIILLLLVIIIIVIKIVKLNNSPLRGFNKI